jgi:hypothetical protein
MAGNLISVKVRLILSVSLPLVLDESKSHDSTNYIAQSWHVQIPLIRRSLRYLLFNMSPPLLAPKLFAVHMVKQIKPSLN